MNILSKKNYFRYLIVMLNLTTYFPLLTQNMPPLIGSHHIWTPIWSASLLIFYNKVFQNKLLLSSIIFLGLFTVVMYSGLIWNGIDNWTVSNSIEEVYILLMAISVYAYFNKSQDFEGWAIITRLTIILLFVTAVLTIFTSYIDPLYVRKIIGGEYENPHDILKFGGGTYSFASVLICLFPILIFYFRNNEGSVFSKKFLFLFIVIFIIAEIRMQIFANILISVIIIVFSLFGRKRLTRSLVISFAVILIFLMIPKNLYGEMMIRLSKLFDSESDIFYKLNDFNEFILHGSSEETAAGYRSSRFPLLLNAFLNHPVLGHLSFKGAINIGEGAHLFWFYKLAAFGIVFFILYIRIFFNHFLFTIEVFSERVRFYYILSLISIIILGVIKNLAGRELWYFYFFILQGTYYLPLLNKKDINSLNKLNI